jgi:hypothetical protein
VNSTIYYLSKLLKRAMLKANSEEIYLLLPSLQIMYHFSFLIHSFQYISRYSIIAAIWLVDHQLIVTIYMCQFACPKHLIFRNRVLHFIIHLSMWPYIQRVSGVFITRAAHACICICISKNVPSYILPPFQNADTYIISRHILYLDTYQIQWISKS